MDIMSLFHTKQYGNYNYRTIYDFTLLNGYTGKCVRLSRLLAFECTVNHYTFISYRKQARIKLYTRGTESCVLPSM